MSQTGWILLVVGLIFAWAIIDRITKTIIGCSYLKMIGKISERADSTKAGNELVKLLNEKDDIL